MADLVLGIAKPLAEGILTRAQSAVEEESKFRKSTQRDLVFITGEFQMMQSFLSATTEENVKSNVVSTWVTQVRDLAYDVEDGIEFVVHLDRKSDWVFRFIPSFMRPSLPLDEAIDIIVELKVRVQDVSQRNERYKLISDSGPSTGMLTKQPAAVAEDTAWKQRDMEALTKLITKKSSDLQVISVWVPGGDIQAASIIRKAYDNSKSWGDFKFRASVSLGQPFDLSEIIRSLHEQFATCSPPKQRRANIRADSIKGMEGNLPEDYLQEFKKLVNNKRYLIVLEDVATTKEEWDTIRKCLPESRNGSRVFVSTRHFEVANICTGFPCFQRFSADLSFCVFFKEGPLIGRISEIHLLRDYLAKTRVNALQVMSVWGIAGSGKSALVRDLYRKKQMETLPESAVCSSQKKESAEYEKYMWVDVTHPFNLKDICHSILLQFRPNSGKANEDTIKECHGLLKDHKCLLVVDNLQSTEEWDLIHDALAFRPSESIIIVVTNEERTALHCADRKDFALNVKALEVGAAVDMFKREVQASPFSRFDGIDDDLVLQQLISKCGGLPKVIVAIADSLASVFEWSKRAIIVNELFIKNLETRHEFGYLRDFFNGIHSYFRSCPDFLKPCIFYLSIFPKSQIIRRRRLVMRWVAEGYSKDTSSDSAEESAEELFGKILELSMIQPVERTIITNMRMFWCQVNAFFQEYIISRPDEENISFALEVFALKGCCRQTAGRAGRHLVIESSWQRDEIVFERIDFSRLRSLTVFGDWRLFFISESMKVLRVLDLENASGVTEKDLKKILKLLRRLKFLSLRGCKDIRNLPSSVGDLRQLQVLDLRYTSIISIPTSITKLKKLQYLRAGTNAPPETPPEEQTVPCSKVFKVFEFHKFLQPVGVEVTSGVGKLTMLHTLGVVNVEGAGGKEILKEIKHLTQLRKLGVFGVSKKNRKEFTAVISGHSHLQSLLVWFNNHNQDCLDSVTSEITNEASEPPKKLQSLKLYGVAKNLPVWMNRPLDNLRKLNLEIDVLSNDDMKVLGALPELCILRLHVKRPTDELKFCLMIQGAGTEERSYKRVRILEIACCSGSLVSFGTIAMQNLELLKAGCCTGSTMMQFGELKHLKKLKEVYVVGSHDDPLKRELETILIGHPCEPTLKLEEVDQPASPRNETPESSEAAIAHNFPFSCPVRQRKRHA